MTEAPRPSVTEPTDVVLLVTTAAISPLDVIAFRDGSPSVPGHEFAGVVVEAGPAVRNVDIDDLVVSRACAASGEVFGSSPALSGGHAEYIRVPDADVTLIRITAAAEERTVLAGGSVALGIQAAEMVISSASDGATVLVWGCDTAGLVAVRWLRRRGEGRLNVVAADDLPARLALARQFGAAEFDANGGGAEKPGFVVAGALSEAPPVEGLRAVACPETFLILAEPYALGGNGDSGVGEEVLSAFREVSACHWPALEEVRRTVLAIQLRQLDLTPLVSHVSPLDQASEAYARAANLPPGTQRVLLKP